MLLPFCSVTGYSFFLNSSLVSWALRKQPTVALHTAEAEYIATSAAGNEATWLKWLVDDMELPTQNEPIKLCSDNNAGIAIANDCKVNHKTKHIDIRIHNIWGKIEKKQITLEYIPTKEESTINNIFDRINRNVAKLTAQELRHARLDGIFIKCAEDLTEIFKAELPQNFPRFDPQSRRQMKDVEFTAQLLLLLELGPKGYSQDDLDTAFTDRDPTWENKNKIESLFNRIVEILKTAIETPDGSYLTRTRLRNQADFYSLFGAIGILLQENKLPSIENILKNLQKFIETVEDADLRSSDEKAKEYYEAARGASTDTGPRKMRIEIIKSIISNISE